MTKTAKANMEKHRDSAEDLQVWRHLEEIDADIQLLAEAGNVPEFGMRIVNRITKHVKLCKSIFSKIYRVPGQPVEQG